MNATSFKPGDRIKLVSMNDPYRDAPIGAKGTVLSVCPPPINTLDVDWDNGFGLNPCLDEDIVAKIND